MKGFKHVYFLVTELTGFCSVGGFLRESLREGHFCFNFNNIWDLAESFSHPSSTEPSHEVTKLLVFIASMNFHCVLLPRSSVLRIM